MSKSRKIAAHYLLTPQGLRSQSILCLDSQGRVEDIVFCENIDSQSGVEFYNGILIPDMVNAHCHLELSYLHGAIASGGGFARFAQDIGRVRNNFGLRTRLAAADLADAKMYAQGVGAVADICNGSTTIDIKRRSKIDYSSFAELFGLANNDLSPIKGVLADFKAAGLPINPTPHSVYSLNKNAFNACVEAGEGPLSIHFMESDAEGLLFDKKGHLWEWYQARDSSVDFLDERSPVQRIINNIPSSRKVMLIHCTKIKKDDLERLVDHFGDNLTCVICPQSNLYIESQTIDIEVLRAAGCRIAVGTDSLASAHNLSMIDQIKPFESVPLEERLRWLTIGGAQALGLEDSMGVIDKGRTTGVVLVGGVDFETMTLRENAFTKRLA